MSEERLGKAYLYPAQIWKSQKLTTTLSVEDHLSCPDNLNQFPNTPPLMMHTPFSRFRISILDKSKTENNNVACNIRPSDETAYLYDRYKSVINNPPKASKESLPLAYTCKFINGDYKGKTPAEVLIDDPTKVSLLRRSQQFLRTNLEKYPNNKKMIDAIDNAIMLLESGDLYPRNTDSYELIVFEEKFKLMDNNKTQASICISYNANMDCPWKFVISNADVVNINGDKVETKNYRTLTYYLGPKQMSGFIWTMKSIQQCFEMSHYPNQKASATNIIIENIENYRKQKNS